MAEGEIGNAVCIPRISTARSAPKGLKKMWSPGSLDGVHAVAESIAAKGYNNLYRASCYFADPARYRSFCALYAVMRVVDDRIDELVVRRHLTEAERRRETEVLEGWRCAVKDCLREREPRLIDVTRTEHPDATPMLDTFAAAVRTFPTPAHLWDRFFAAMRRDLEQRRFATYGEFVDYAGGAAVSPATIYLYLIAAERDDGSGAYRSPPDFGLIRCGRELGLFAYLGHILRDLADDLGAGEQGLLYLALDDMAAHGVAEEGLRADLAAQKAGPRLRALTRDLSDRARVLVRRGRSRLRALENRLSVDRAFILELIIRTYEAVLHKIAQHSFDTMSARHRLTEREKQAIVKSVARESRQDCYLTAEAGPYGRLWVHSLGGRRAIYPVYDPRMRSGLTPDERLHG